MVWQAASLTDRVPELQSLSLKSMGALERSEPVLAEVW